MAYELENKLVVGVSSRTLFDLTYENKIFEEEGVEAYSRYQVEQDRKSTRLNYSHTRASRIPSSG